jgi:hypothetical protein
MIAIRTAEPDDRPRFGKSGKSFDTVFLTCYIVSK